MSLSQALLPKKCAEVICQHLPDGSALLFDTRKRTSAAVTQSAAIVWEACDGSRSPDSIVTELFQIYEAPGDVVAADVTGLLEDFARQGFIEPINQPT